MGVNDYNPFFYGVQMTSKVYHINKHCPELERIKKTFKNKNCVRELFIVENIEDLVNSEIIIPCPVCCNFKLNDDQYRLFIIINGIMYSVLITSVAYKILKFYSNPSHKNVSKEELMLNPGFKQYNMKKILEGYSSLFKQNIVHVNIDQVTEKIEFNLTTLGYAVIYLMEYMIDKYSIERRML